MEIVMQRKRRNRMFLLFAATVFILFSLPLYTLIRFALGDDTFSYIPLIPLVSAYFFWENRKEIFSGRDEWYPIGGALIAGAIVLYIYGASQAGRLSENTYLTVMPLSLVACWAGGVGLFFGPEAWRAGAFPLVFLLFMIPIPGMILDPIVSVLQRGSAEVSYGFFRMIGVPVYREGFLFNLPGMTIEVAKQCSGIRSSLSLLLISIITAHLFLKRGWSKGILCLSVVPITIFKNGVRIVSLSLLAAYVDRGILESELHRSGGILIFVIALLLLGGVLWLVKKAERKKNPIPAS